MPPTRMQVQTAGPPFGGPPPGRRRRRRRACPASSRWRSPRRGAPLRRVLLHGLHGDVRDLHHAPAVADRRPGLPVGAVLPLVLLVRANLVDVVLVAAPRRGDDDELHALDDGDDDEHEEAVAEAGGGGLADERGPEQRLVRVEGHGHKHDVDEQRKNQGNEPACQQPSRNRPGALRRLPRRVVVQQERRRGLQEQGVDRHRHEKAHPQRERRIQAVAHLPAVDHLLENRAVPCRGGLQALHPIAVVHPGVVDVQVAVVPDAERPAEVEQVGGQEAGEQAQEHDHACHEHCDHRRLGAHAGREGGEVARKDRWRERLAARNNT
mmetsp:Transcript_87574/g.243869  ORF Transcript_87574/g.243869 Transcript_87574/m.243869 type:complete len:323 (-) Transcript_87574:54-1022(-)